MYCGNRTVVILHYCIACPAIASEGNSDIELSTYATAVGTDVVIGCTGFGRHVSEPTNVQCLSTGAWSQTPNLTCNTQLDEKERIILVVAAVCAVLVIIALAGICCCVLRKKRRHRYFWKNGYKESSPVFINDKGTRHYNDYSSKHWRSFRSGDQYAGDNKGHRSGFFSKFRQYFGTDKRLSDRQEIIKSGRSSVADKSHHFRQTQRYVDGDKKSSSRQEMIKSQGSYDYVKPPAEYRRTRRFSDSDGDTLSVNRLDFITSRRNSDDYMQPPTGYRRSRRGSDPPTYTPGHHRPKHEKQYDSRPKQDYSTTYKQNYDVTGVADVTQQRYDREPIIVKYDASEFRHTPPADKTNHRVNFLQTPTEVQYNDQLQSGYAHPEVVQYTGPPRILDPIYYTQPQQFSHLSNPRYTESRYVGAPMMHSNMESNTRIDPLLHTDIMKYLKHTLNGNGIGYGSRPLPATRMVDVDGDRLRNGRVLGTTVLGYDDGQFETTSINPSTNYFFGRQDYPQESRTGTNEREPNHVLYHGKGKTTEIFENATENSELFNKN